MEDSYYRSLEPFWGTWHIVKKLGEGAFGKVYEIEREDFGKKYKSALKVITVPPSESEWQSLMADGLDELSATSYFKGFVSEIVNEIALMSELRGHSNIVSYEDHMVMEHEDKHGWDILLRMELLTPFLKTFSTEYSLDREQVIKLGIDICKALELCQAKKVIHRDIKPENIFLSQTGDYKLGDFGIARTAEKTSGAMSKKGTYTYMAPEVFKGEAYGASVDIYSLGIVLYRLLNRHRTPFLPPYPNPIGYMDKENALNRRFSGETFDLPIDAQDDLGRIILKACAYKPEDRYQSASELRKELERISGEGADGKREYEDEDRTESIYPVKPQNIAKQDPFAPLNNVTQEPYTAGNSLQNAAVQSGEKNGIQETKQNGSRSNKLPVILAAIAAGVVLLIVAGIVLSGLGKKGDQETGEYEARETVTRDDEEDEKEKTTPTITPTKKTEPTETPTSVPTATPTSASTTTTTATQSTSDEDIVLIANDVLILGDNMKFNIKAGSMILYGESPTITWSSDDESIIKVDSGVGTALKTGTTTVRGVYEGKEASKSITVVDVKNKGIIETSANKLTLKSSSMFSGDPVDVDVILNDPPERYALYFYYTADIKECVYLSWKESDEADAVLTIEPSFSTGEGDIRLYVASQDDPYNVVDSKAIHVKVE